MIKDQEKNIIIKSNFKTKYIGFHYSEKLKNMIQQRLEEKWTSYLEILVAEIVASGISLWTSWWHGDVATEEKQSLQKTFILENVA